MIKVELIFSNKTAILLKWFLRKRYKRNQNTSLKTLCKIAVLQERSRAQEEESKKHE